MDRRIKASRTQEKKLAKDIGGTTVAGSGAGWAVKNDVRNKTWSVECKTTGASRFPLTHRDLVKAEQNALLDLRRMAFAVEMQGRTWVTVSLETFLGLIEREEDT
ncbi:hypothetical protein AB0M10_15650 [Streptomyces sp. NPDC051840]|uniref:hypothetical protein n=1 Tax=Streptomyces sp. NPDC051840 TaxID=3154752 RepID=UPI003432BDEF